MSIALYSQLELVSHEVLERRALHTESVVRAGEKRSELGGPATRRRMLREQEGIARGKCEASVEERDGDEDVGVGLFGWSLVS